MTDDAASSPWAEIVGPWAEIVGPCYTVASLARTLGWTEDEAIEAGDHLRLLKLRTSDGVLLFPAFQLLDGKVVTGLTRVLVILEIGTADPWTWAQWLNTELPDADPPRNIQYLYDGRLDEAIRDAKHDACAWRS
ncbi:MULTISPECIES: hypothetical protein [unclassified Microbacterium]|uniref:hypothetical protein n=1 Tax=unclassified Microbacterium TaxID=2609290 RepID=UPI000EA8E74B|nr:MULTISPECIES: hypothetical protein [unclassified Microbacterium]MBT2485901.1 hypothetical protein [Microbacterium sp. ISL-108]RKN68656.1 hypothetical protein D7252_14415 [Microbacterium sp. CGR2]